MSAFNKTINKLESQYAHILLGGQPVKVFVKNIVDDLVHFEVVEPDLGYTSLSMHLQNIVLISPELHEHPEETKPEE